MKEGEVFNESKKKKKREDVIPSTYESTPSAENYVEATSAQQLLKILLGWWNVVCLFM
jgi:hypothetical protein